MSAVINKDNSGQHKHAIVPNTDGEHFLCMATVISHCVHISILTLASQL